jgi:LytR cell envelope-related transcriptional attenuator
VDYPLHHDRPVAHEHPLAREHELAGPWRNAALIAGLVAVVELVLLVIVGGALLAKPEPHSGAKAVAKREATANANATAATAPSKPKPTPRVAAQLPRAKVTVLVLNGNGRQGAAAAQASRVTAKGYRIGAVGNASSDDFTRSLVMYRTGFEGEGRRLARDLGIRIVGPLDGMRPSQLHGAQAVVVVGA